MERFIKEVIEIIKKRKPSKENLAKIKLRLCRKYKLKKIPTDIELLLNAPSKEIQKIRKYLTTKPTRTISGVAVCAIMTKPIKCPHTKKGIGPCIMCPGGPDSYFGDVPQSYTGKEPATRRAIRNNYDPYLQVMNRLEQYVVQGHIPDKVELIIMGGTFPSFQKRYKEDFIKYAFKAMNDFSELFFNKRGEIDIIKFKEFFELPGNIFDKNRTKNIQKKLLKIKKKSKSELEEEQKRNEKSNIRCVSLLIETRPDYATLKHANEMLELGCTKVEIGVQTIYDNILKKIRRGHTTEDSIRATQILKDLGFKVGYHWMVGLPGMRKKEEIIAFAILFSSEYFRPDMLKIYPCMVLKGTKLYKEWKRKRYKPITTKEAIKLISRLKSMVPEYVRITRVQRDIPTYTREAGVDKTNLRQYIQEYMKKNNMKCRCIRCREAGHILRKKKIKPRIQIVTRHYLASGGNEFFISAEDLRNDILFGYCRLRFPYKFLRKEINEDSAIIRELHIYSPIVQIGKKSESSYQHRGIGKKLLKVAEQTAKRYYKKKLVVIAGIGAREYFRKLGYKKEGPYMSKRL